MVMARLPGMGREANFGGSTFLDRLGLSRDSSGLEPFRPPEAKHRLVELSLAELSLAACR